VTNATPTEAAPTLSDVVVLLENAKEPDRFLDHLIAVAIGEYPSSEIKAINYDAKCVWFRDTPPEMCGEYTSSVDAALCLAERLNCYSLTLTIDPSGHGAEITYWPEGLSNDRTIKSNGVTAGLPAIAICIAVIQAILKEQSA